MSYKPVALSPRMIALMSPILRLMSGYKINSSNGLF